MSAKERKDYSTFMNGIHDKHKPKFNDKPNPIGAGLVGPYAFQKNFVPPQMYPPMFAPNGFAPNGFTTNAPMNPSFIPQTKTAFN